MINLLRCRFFPAVRQLNRPKPTNLSGPTFKYLQTSLFTCLLTDLLILPTASVILIFKNIYYNKTLFWLTKGCSFLLFCNYKDVSNTLMTVLH